MKKYRPQDANVRDDCVAIAFFQDVAKNERGEMYDEDCTHSS